MAKLFNRAKMDTSTTGSGTITLGSAVDGYQSFADAGVADSDVVQYVIEDGTSWEIGTGTYSASGTSLTRTPSESSNSGAAISLTGAAEVFISAIHSDFEKLQNAGTTKVEATSTGATVTGNLAVTGTVDGVDIAARDAVLTSTTTTADAALPKAGGTVTGNTTFSHSSGITIGEADVFHQTTNTWRGLTVKNNGDSNEVTIDGQSSDGTQRLSIYGETSSQGFLNPTDNSWKLKLPNSGSFLRDDTHTIWDSGNDGSGSGLDADTLDGSHASAFASASHDHNRLIAIDDRDMKPNTSGVGSGVKGIKAFFSSYGGMTGSANTDYQDVLVLDTYSDTSGGNASAITIDKSDATMRIWSAGQTATSWGAPKKVWTDANDGSGSGLDADKLDGVQGSSFLRSDADDTVSAGVTYTWSNTDTHGLQFTNASYGTQLRIGGWTTSNSSNISRIRTSSGNLHIDSASNGNCYLNWYSGGTIQCGSDVVLNTKNLSGINNAYIAANIFHTNDTNTYFGFHANDQWRVVTAGSERLEVSNDRIQCAAHVRLTSGHYLERLSHSSGHLVGSYNSVGANSTRSNPIYTIGSSYNPADTTLSNMYGVGYTHTNASFVSLSGDGTGWGLYVASDGDCRGFWNASQGHLATTGNVTAYASDERLKENITAIPNAIDKVKKLNGVTFDWVGECEEIGFHPTVRHETGVIAQNVQEVIPDAVYTAPFNGIATERAGEDKNYLTVDKEKIIPLLIEAIKEQQQQIEALQETINALTN